MGMSHHTPIFLTLSSFPSLSLSLSRSYFPKSPDAMEEDELAELESNMDDELEGSDAEILGVCFVTFVVVICWCDCTLT